MRLRGGSNDPPVRHTVSYCFGLFLFITLRQRCAVVNRYQEFAALRAATRCSWSNPCTAFPRLSSAKNSSSVD